MTEPELVNAPSLVFPVYLDVPMMVSFLAALTEGVSFEQETVLRADASADRGREAGAGIRVPALSSLLGFDASGRMSQSDRTEETQQTRAVRQHTAASLFNALHQALDQGGAIKSAESVASLERLVPGDLVSITGDFIGNPLLELLSFFAQALPYFGLTEQSEEVQQAAQFDFETANQQVTDLQAQVGELREQAAEASRSGNPARRAEAARLETEAAAAEEQIKAVLEGATKALATLQQWRENNRGLLMINQMREDLAQAAVHDCVLKAADFQAVLTLSSEFFTDATSAFLRAGVFTAVGKVTKVLGHGDSINLMRRTVLGAAGSDFARDMISNSGSETELKLDTFDPIIEPPAVQVLPLAVFV